MKSWRMRLAGHIARIGEVRKECKILVGKNRREGISWKPGLKIILI
jgi:hypothetical protein